MANLSIRTDKALITDNAVPVGNGTTQVASNITDDGTTVTIDNTDADVAEIALTGVDYSALGPGDPGEAYEYAALTVQTEGPHIHGTAQDRPTYALRVIAEDYDGNGDSNHQHYGIYVRSRNAGIGEGGLPGASFGPAIHVAEGDVYFADNLDVAGDADVAGALTENGARVLVNAGTGLSKSTNTVSLASNLDLSGNGTTTVGDFRGQVQQVGTTGTINDLALDADAAIVEFTGAGAVTLNGIAGGADGRLVMIVNRTGNDIIVVNEAGGSTAVNRLTTVGTLNWYIPANSHGWIEYNGSSSRWIGENHYRSYAVSTVTSLGVGTNATVNGTLTVGGATTLNGNATVGNATSDTLTVNATTTLSATKGVVQTSAGGSGTLNDLALDDNALVLNLNYGTLTLTGITGGVDGRVLILFSQGTSTVTLSNDTGSTAANRFYTENGAGQTLYAKGCAVLVYSGTLSRWVVSIRNRFPLLTVDGTATLNGNTTLGNATTDVVTFNGHADGAALLIGRQVITASGTYTPTSGTYKVLVKMVGGGGGGGGAQTQGAGGGGASGVYFEKWIDPGAAITSPVDGVTIGAGGAGGTSTGGNGGVGGDTSVVINGTTYTAKGGNGGTGITTGTLPTVRRGGSVQAGSSAGDIVFGQAGGYGHADGGGGTIVTISGAGGSTPLGAGGGSIEQAMTSLAGAGYGSGGGGGANYDYDLSGGIASAGGAGAAGVVIIEEYR